MKIRQIVWDEDTAAHIARHGVDTQEVEDACFNSNPLVLKTRLNRYIALGQTVSGRHLTVIFEYLGQGRAKVITARAMAEPERRLYKRR